MNFEISNLMILKCNPPNSLNSISLKTLRRTLNINRKNLIFRKSKLLSENSWLSIIMDENAILRKVHVFVSLVIDKFKDISSECTY